MKREELNQSQLNKSDTKSKVRSNERYTDEITDIEKEVEEEEGNEQKEYRTPEDNAKTNKFSNIALDEGEHDAE